MCSLIQTEGKNIKLHEVCPLKRNTNIWNSPLFRQMFVALGPTALVFCGGISQGTATVMIPQLKANDTDIQLTQNIESWLYSMHGFAATPSVLIVPYLSYLKGYKLIFMFVCIPIIISFVLQYLATSAIHLMIAAICQGLTMGGSVTLGVIIVSEFPAPKYRGTFLILKSATHFWGVWISNAVGTFFSWRIIPLVGISPAVFALVSSFFWPESPYWLASKNRVEECQKAFRWVRGRGIDAEKELMRLTSSKNSEQKSENILNFVKTTIFYRQFYMPLFLTISMFFLYHSCGKIVVQTYVLTIIKDITNDSAAAYTGMLIIDGVTVFGMYLGSLIAAKVNRRTMMFSTTASSIILLFVFSAYLYFIQFDVITQNNTLSLCLLILYSFSVSWGPMVLCISIFSEITPMKYKTFQTSVTVCFMFVMQTGFLKVAPLIFKRVGLNGAFAVYGALSIFPFLFLYKFLPETRNKTLEEIELCFVKNHHNVSTIEEDQEMLNCNDNKNL